MSSSSSLHPWRLTGSNQIHPHSRARDDTCVQPAPRFRCYFVVVPQLEASAWYRHDLWDQSLGPFHNQIVDQSLQTVPVDRIVDGQVPLPIGTTTARATCESSKQGDLLRQSPSEAIDHALTQHG